MNVLNKKLSKNSGFTLVEMLIVVAIIAILIAVSIPLISSSLEKARHAVDDANKRDAIALATVTYLTETNLFVTSGTDAYKGPGAAAKDSADNEYIKFSYSVSKNQQGELKKPDDTDVAKGQCTQQTSCASTTYNSNADKALLVAIAKDGKVYTSWDSGADATLFPAE